MDSITQAALGASIAALSVPAGHRRRALVAGAVLGTLPDLDVLIDYGDAVRNFTMHRGFSHSLFVLPPFAVLLWLALRRWWAPVRAAPRAWLVAIFLALVTHPLLDAHTAYGTQLLWPLATPPVSWSTLFIIDPAYTLPLLIAVLVVAAMPSGHPARVALVAGLALSTAYVGWTWVAKLRVEQVARAALPEQHAGAPIFSVPTPLNSVLWRVIVMTDDGYLEGFYSFAVPARPIGWGAYPSDRGSLEVASHVGAVARLRWFAADFVKAEVVEDVLLVTDLRMGQEPRYVFRHAVARREGPEWVAISPERVRTLLSREDVADVWARIFDP